MRIEITALAMLTAAACADGAEPTVPYDEVARIVATDLVTSPGRDGELGAIADAVWIARGITPRGLVHADGSTLTHGDRDGILYAFEARCRGSHGKPQACGRTTESADVSAVWMGRVVTPHVATTFVHRGTWTLRGLTTEAAWVRGEAQFFHGARFATSPDTFWLEGTKELALLVDLDDVRVAGGSMPLEVGVTRYADGLEPASFAVHAETTFEPTRLRIELDGGPAYWLDPATGALTAAVTLE